MVQVVDSTECCTVHGEQFDVSYSITKCVSGYGILVDKISKDGSLIESSSVDNLFADKQKTMVFLNIISNGFVTPMSLKDIAYDYISEMYS